MTEAEAQAIFLREIAIVGYREVSGSAAVCVVLGHNRIEVAGGPVAGCAGREGVASPGILKAGGGTGRVEAAAGEDGLAMQARMGVPLRVDFDDSAHFSAVFSGNARGEYVQRVNLPNVKFRAGAWRAIVGKGDAVDDELSLIFGAARVKNRVALIEPAGLRVDEIGESASGKRSGTVGYGFGVEVIDGGGAFGIEKSAFRSNVHGSAEGGDVELDEVIGGQSGMDLDDAVIGGKRLAAHLKPIEAEKKIAGHEVAGVVGGKRAAELKGVTGKVDKGLERKAVRACDFEAKFTRVALG